MNDNAVAYSFSQYKRQDVFELEVQGSPAVHQSIKRTVELFTTGEECRKVMRRNSASVSVIVCGYDGLVTPINLAAALCFDEPERDVYLVEDSPTESLATRAKAAGIRGILNGSQARRLLDISHGMTMMKAALPNTTPSMLLAEAKAVTEGVAGDTPQPADPATPDNYSEPGNTLRLVAPSRTLKPINVPQVTFEERPGQGRIIGFLSGRGGVGKSTVALMTALFAQRRGARVALVDLDLQFGDLDYLAGNEPSSRIQRLPLEQSATDIDRCVLSDEALTLIIPPKHPEQGEKYASSIPLLLNGLAKHKDLVVINTGSFWTEIHAQMAQCCNHLAFLMDQRATSIEACKQVVDLCVRMQLPRARFVYLLNGCGRHASLTPMDVTLALGGVEVLGLADGGSLVDELLALGCPMELLASGNAFVSSLENLLENLLGPQESPVVSKQKTARANGKTRAFDTSFIKDLFSGVYRVAT